VLVVPYAGAFTTAGERIVVAWNASRESARAVADGLIRYLGRHGVNANAINAHAAEKDVGDQLLSRALDRGADLLVMGAYGHSRFRELVLGGTTRAVLRRMTLPVLMSH
jgi:nucleotide-binding universal stress UspA family protein